MSNFSKEKVLEWVNSSEARAAKYEQEAKVTEQYDYNNCIGHPHDTFEIDANYRLAYYRLYKILGKSSIVQKLFEPKSRQSWVLQKQCKF